MSALTRRPAFPTLQPFPDRGAGPSGGSFFMSRIQSDTVLIEVDDEAIGLAQRTRGGFRFFSSLRRLDALDGRDFRSLGAIEAAARDLMRRRQAAPARRQPAYGFAGGMFAAA
ncbi:MAG: hypothetical protein QM722_00015 [Piscinibacter sp.]